MDNDFLPLSAFQHLEPQPGGKWAVVDQTEDSIAISYVVNGVPENVSHTIFPCTTEEEIQSHCQAYVYDFCQTTSGPIMQLESQVSQSQTPIVGLNLPVTHGERMAWQNLSPQRPLDDVCFNQLSFCSDNTHQSTSPESNQSPQFPDIGVEALHQSSNILNERLALSSNSTLPAETFGAPSFDWAAQQSTFISNLATVPGEPGLANGPFFQSKADAPCTYWNTTWMQS